MQGLLDMKRKYDRIVLEAFRSDATIKKSVEDVRFVFPPCSLSLSYKFFLSFLIFPLTALIFVSNRFVLCSYVRAGAGLCEVHQCEQALARVPQSVCR